MGAIFAEMLKGSPLFPVSESFLLLRLKTFQINKYTFTLSFTQGENDIDQLYLVISSLGTPNEEIWPGHAELPDYNKISFSKMAPVPMRSLVPSSVPGCTDFLEKFLVYDSSKRSPAKTVRE